VGRDICSFPKAELADRSAWGCGKSRAHFSAGAVEQASCGVGGSEVTSAHAVEIICFSRKQELLSLCWGSGAVLWDCHRAALPVLAGFPSAPWPARLCTHPSKAPLHPHITVWRRTAAPKGILQLLTKVFLGKKKTLGRPRGLRRCWQGAGQVQSFVAGRFLASMTRACPA